MTQIENLIVVEVPKGCKWHMRQTELAVFHGDFTVHQLPFPCSIIGLASELDHNGYYEIEQAASMLYQHIVNQHSLTSPNFDYLFLKRKG